MRRVTAAFVCVFALTLPVLAGQTEPNPATPGPESTAPGYGEVVPTPTATSTAAVFGEVVPMPLTLLAEELFGHVKSGI
jgi:hypothetical protein